ncbi:unnamed protein product [Acanthosepion pharaonis]|uniref:Uncharacterized protein n=1 Tax=Acanthosepion pharaonis TaxID=158019 RepID=A0A812DNQ5_ACAPH|nr:unnamed protein product [Sepia pharaonis]
MRIFGADDDAGCRSAGCGTAGELDQDLFIIAMGGDATWTLPLMPLNRVSRPQRPRRRDDIDRGQQLQEQTDIRHARDGGADDALTVETGSVPVDPETRTVCDGAGRDVWAAHWRRSVSSPITVVGVSAVEAAGGDTRAGDDDVACTRALPPVHRGQPSRSTARSASCVGVACGVHRCAQLGVARYRRQSCRAWPGPSSSDAGTAPTIRPRHIILSSRSVLADEVKHWNLRRPAAADDLPSRGMPYLLA